MIFLRNPYLYHAAAEAVPSVYPAAVQLQGNLAQFRLIARTCRVAPVSGQSGRWRSTIVNFQPFPFAADALGGGAFKPAPNALRPHPQPPAWVPQGATKYWGGNAPTGARNV